MNPISANHEICSYFSCLTTDDIAVVNKNSLIRALYVCDVLADKIHRLSIVFPRLRRLRAGSRCKAVEIGPENAIQEAPASDLVPQLRFVDVRPPAVCKVQVIRDERRGETGVVESRKKFLHAGFEADARLMTGPLGDGLALQDRHIVALTLKL